MNGGVDFTESGVEYLYTQGISLVELRPSEGRADKAGQTVTVIGRGFMRMGELRCWFGVKLSTMAHYVSSSMVLCTSTATQAGTLTVRVASDGDMRGLAGLPYNVLPSRAGVTSVRPSAGPVVGGSSVRLTGLLADRSFSCRFGATVVAGQVDPAGQTRCETPASDTEGVVQVQVKQAGDETTFEYEYHARPRIAQVWHAIFSISGDESAAMAHSCKTQNRDISGRRRVQDKAARLWQGGQVKGDCNALRGDF